MTTNLGYKYDNFDANGKVKSSVSPTARFTNKMFGGRQVEIGEVPWQVGVLYQLGYYSNHAVQIGSEYYYSIGSGVIISTTKILPTASNIDDGTLKSASKFQIIAGHSNITSSKQTVGLEKFVYTVTIYSSYHCKF